MLQRPLDKFESMLVDFPNAFTVEYEGLVDELSLGRALSLLSIEYPVLRGVIRKDSRGCTLQAPPNHSAEFTVLLENGTDQLRKIAQDWDVERCLAHLVLIRDQDRGVVALCADHAIADGRSMFAMFSRLWRLYTDVVAGSEISVSHATRLPSSPLELLRRHLPPGQPTGDSQILPAPTLSEIFTQDICLDETETEGLIATSRVHSISLTSLVGAALLIGHRQSLESHMGSVSMFCSVQVDLRSRIDPPVAPTETTNLATAAVVTTAVPATGDPLTIGLDIDAKLKGAISRNDPLFKMLSWISPCHNGSPAAAAVAPAHGVTVSNLGGLGRFSVPETLEIVDFQVRRYSQSTPNAQYAVYTYGGKLRVAGRYRCDRFSRDEAELVIAKSAEQLRRLSIAFWSNS